mmetsp:Transcript_4955/g.6720  ORF Transcript_4955/g.6720 Transcript_4955/m.6720 type:complete len:200 (+) Transcript_4955:299-898(+)
MTTTATVNITDSSHGQQLLSDGGRHKSGTTRGRDKTNTDTTTLTSHLSRNGVREPTHTSPVTTTDRNDIELSNGNSTTNGSGNLTGALHSKTNVPISISNGNKGLETSTLTGRRLLLNRHNLHNLILKLSTKEMINNLSLLHRDGVKKDLLETSNLSIQHETTQLGNRSPLLSFTGLSTTTSTTATASTTSETSTGCSF